MSQQYQKQKQKLKEQGRQEVLKEFDNFIEKLKEEIMDLSILQKNVNLDFKAIFVDIINDKIDKLAKEFREGK